MLTSPGFFKLVYLNFKFHLEQHLLEILLLRQLQCSICLFQPSYIAQSVAYRTLEQEVASLIPGSANILFEDRLKSLRQDLFLSHHCTLFGHCLRYVRKQPVALK